MEDFEGVPELFNVLAASPVDELDFNWNVFTFQMDFDKVLGGPKIHNFPIDTNDKHLEESLKERDNIMTVNCTVIYFDQCTSFGKCRQSCLSTGASSYR